MTQDDSWQPCKEGTIRNVVERQRSQQHGRLTTRRAVVTGIAASAAGLSLVLLRAFQTSPLSCQQVTRLAREYINGALSEDQIQRIDDHRAQCENCDRMLNRLSTKSLS